MKIEFDRVCHLSNKIKTRITINRDPQDIFLNDPLSVLNKVGKKIEKKLEEAGVRDIGELMQMKPEDLANIRQVAGL